MNIFCKDFEFNGVSSKKYDLIVCNYDGHQERKDNVMTWTLNHGEMNPYRSRPNYYNKRYENVLEFQLSLVKHDNTYFTPNERTEIIRWLTSPITFSKLILNDCYYTNGYYHHNVAYNAIVTNYSELTVTGNVDAMTFSFKCDAPYGYAPEEVYNFESIDTYKFKINNTSDELYEYYYPIIEVQGTSTGKISFSSSASPDEILTINIKNGQKLSIDCKLGIVNFLNTATVFDYENDINRKWLKLASGENEITVNGKCSGRIRCTYIRKVGI